jgi:hypothetical protein
MLEDYIYLQAFLSIETKINVLPLIEPEGSLLHSDEHLLVPHGPHGPHSYSVSLRSV